MAISAEKMVEKLGREKAQEIMVNSQGKQTGAWLQKQRRWGRGKTCYAICAHGKCIVRDYKPTGDCDSCNSPDSYDGGRHFKPYFNAGLGVMIEYKGEENKIAKSMGLRPTG